MHCMCQRCRDKRRSTCRDCDRWSAEQSRRWGFGVTALCASHQAALVARFQRVPMAGKRGNHISEGLL